MRVDNAIIMAAGTSSRFAPLSYEKHKAMIDVRGEVLIERQIRQLKEACIPEIYVITGYKAEQFEYLRDKYGIKLIHNPDYPIRNNNSSIWAARSILANSYICSADNYFSQNPFEYEVDSPYYAAEYADGPTEEWCMTEDENGFINTVTIGGQNAWYMMGHAFWDRAFSERFLGILEDVYNDPETAGKLWEKIFMAHLDTLKMKIRKYQPGMIFEFDTLNELRTFDDSYKNNTRSVILKKVSADLSIQEQDIVNIQPLKSGNTSASGFEFDSPFGHYQFFYENSTLLRN